MKHNFALTILFLLSINLFSQDVITGTTSNGGTYNAGTIYKVNTDGSDHVILKEFRAGPTPFSGLVNGNEGKLFGMTPVGGDKNCGVIFCIDTSGSYFNILHHFNVTDGARPYGSLILGNDGLLYGMTSEGGINGGGVIFKINTNGSGFEKIFDFSAETGTEPYTKLLQDSDNVLYGITFGNTLFKIKTDGTGFEVIHRFTYNVNNIYACSGTPVLGPDGYIYGFGSGGGQHNFGGIFRVKKDGSDFSISHSFENPGDFILGSLFLGSDNKLYGYTTKNLFSITPDSNDYEVIYNLNMGFGFDKLVEGTDGFIYGTTSWGIFKIKKDGTLHSVLHDFYDPEQGKSALLNAQPIFISDNLLAGVTSSGGYHNSGIIYSIKKDGSDFKILYHFGSEKTECYPYKYLVKSKFSNCVYGYTASGGDEGCGSLFKYDLDSGKYTDFFDLKMSTGYNCSLTEDNTGFLWGATSNTIYKIKNNGTDYTIISELNDSTGKDMRSNFIQLPDNNLYGTFSSRGKNNGGTIVKIDTQTDSLIKIFDFEYFTSSSNTGSAPHGDLLHIDGYLYGITYTGGNAEDGVLYKIKPDGSNFTKLYDFGDGAGFSPMGNIVYKNNYIFGVTWEGGINSKGVIYKIKTDGTSYEEVYDLEQTTPLYGGILLDTVNDKIYGEYDKEFQDNGALFSINTDGSGFKKFVKFSGENGSAPIGIPILFYKDSLFSETICHEEPYSFGSRNLTSSGTYSDVFTSSTGKDSTVVITLNVLPVNETGITKTICEGQTYTFGNQIINSSGYYTEVFESAKGCDSTVFLNLTVDTINTGITTVGGIITANMQGVDYQWLDCNNENNPIDGETSRSFSPSITGRYAVQLQSGTCSVVSECIEFNISGLDENSYSDEISIFPNPSDIGIITIDCNGVVADKIIITDLFGKVIRTIQPVSSVTKVDISALNNSVYFVNILNGNSSRVLKMIKQ